MKTAAEMRQVFHDVARLRALDPFIATGDAFDDRIFFDIVDREGWDKRIAQLVACGDLVALPFDPVKRHHGSTALCSLRGRLIGGLHGDQWIVHEGDRGEMDLDAGSPVDLVGIVAHVWQVWRNRRRRRRENNEQV